MDDSLARKHILNSKWAIELSTVEASLPQMPPESFKESSRPSSLIHGLVTLFDMSGSKGNGARFLRARLLKDTLMLLGPTQMCH